MNYFAKITELQELRNKYRKLAFIHHPDKGGNTEIMQIINAQYAELSKNLINGNETFSSERKFYENKVSDEIIITLTKIISLNGLIIEIIGTWIWVTGNTYFHRKNLKLAGFSYMKNKTAWCWHFGDYRKFNNKLLTLDEMRKLFGTSEVDLNQKKALS